MVPAEYAQLEKEDNYRACLNNLMVIMCKLDPIENMIDAACRTPGAGALHELNKKLYALDRLIETEVSLLGQHSNVHTQRTMPMPDKKCEKFSDHEFETISEVNLGLTNPMDEDPVYEIIRECAICGMIDAYRDV